MRKVEINPQNVTESLREIMRASHDCDLTEIAQNFTISGTYTATTTLNLTSPTAANVAAVLATFLTYCQKGGANRTT